jgi:hypothetical protein
MVLVSVQSWLVIAMFALNALNPYIRRPVVSATIVVAKSTAHATVKVSRAVAHPVVKTYKKAVGEY